MNRKILYLFCVAVVLTSCTKSPKEAYYNRGQPESLLDLSSEVVNLKIESPASIQVMIDVINKDQPARANLSCVASDPLCKEAKKVLQQFKVKTKYVASEKNNVALLYERTLARDCQNRFIDFTRNYQNINSPTFGCSVAVNTVQMVSNKKQFTNPALMGTSESSKPLQALTNYNTFVKQETVFKDISTTSSGSGSASR
ncbi:MAG: hypothetical protein WCJ33_04385 [Pseudomonadota bacterium]